MTTIKMQAAAKNQRLLNGALITNMLEFTEVIAGDSNKTLITQFNINNVSNEMAAQFEVGKVYNISFSDDEVEA